MTDSLFDRFLVFIETGGTRVEFCAQGDVTSRKLNRYMQDHPEEQVRYLALCERMDFAWQSRSRSLGARFAAEVERRYLAGEQDRTVADALGVTRAEVQHRTKVLRWNRVKALLDAGHDVAEIVAATGYRAPNVAGMVNRMKAGQRLAKPPKRRITKVETRGRFDPLADAESV